VYGESGQPMSGSFMDYALPRANDAPMFNFGSHPVPARPNGLGSKGFGEAGAVSDARPGRCTFHVWHQAHRHAGHTVTELRGDTGAGLKWLRWASPVAGCGVVPRTG
jgi:hypothetical protein